MAAALCTMVLGAVSSTMAQSAGNNDGKNAGKTTNSLGMQLQRVAAGHYERGGLAITPFSEDHQNLPGNEDAKPAHPVILSTPCYIGRHEVTVGQFAAFVKATDYRTTAERLGEGALVWDTSPGESEDEKRHKISFRQKKTGNWRAPGFPQTDSHPVTCVSHQDATAFCQWLSKKEGKTYRLPTEAEWEIACRAGSWAPFSFGAKYRGEIHKHANIGNVELERAAEDRVLQQWIVDVERDPGDGHVHTAPVGKFQPNAWGLHDFHGNVWEWCEDRYLDTAYSKYKRDGHQQVRRRAIDPLAMDKRAEQGDWRVIRGGSWFNAPALSRAGIRANFEVGDAACYLGFRVVLEASGAELKAAKQRFQASEDALVKLKESGLRVMERRDGRLYFELDLPQLDDSFFAAWRELDYPVDISVNGRGQLTSEQLAGLAATKNLRGALIRGPAKGVTTADYKPLAQHPLEVLQITGDAQLGDDILRLFSHCTQLQSLNLQGEQITDAGLVAAWPELPKLKTLHLGGTAATGECLQSWAASPLSEVSFRHMTDAASVHLGHFSDTMRSLDLSESPVTGATISRLPDLQRLRSLRLRECPNIKPDDLRRVGEIYYLESLELDGVQAGDVAAIALRSSVELRRLRYGDGLTNEGFAALCEISGLRDLSLEGATKLSDAGLEPLWRLVNLDRLNISGTFTGSGWPVFEELPRLQRLTIRSDAVRPEHFANIAAAKALKSFELRGSEISEEALQSLKSMRPELQVRVR